MHRRYTIYIIKTMLKGNVFLGHLLNSYLILEVIQTEQFLLLNKGTINIRLPFKPTPNDQGRPIHINGEQHAIGKLYYTTTCLKINCQSQ